MLTSAMIKAKARELGASVCGIGRIYDEPDPQRDPRQILPNAKSIIGFGFVVPKTLFNNMNKDVQYYTYTTLGVKYPDEELAEIFLLKIGGMIEDEGYDACLQKSVPNLRVKGDKTTNPEVSRIYELEFSSPVSKDKPAPDVIIDYNKAAKICGLGDVGMHGKIISPKYGSFLRWVFIITDMPLECDAVFEENLCDRCGKCLAACPGKAIGESGVDSWQCSVYYRGAHKSNPFITEKTLENHPEREAILNGEKRFSREEAQMIYKELDFLPKTHFGYLACLCGKACETVCYKHLKEQGKI